MDTDSMESLYLDSQSRSMRAKMTQKNIKQSFAVLDVLFWGLKTSLVGKTSFMKA
jgi:hypothetical protein